MYREVHLPRVHREAYIHPGIPTMVHREAYSPVYPPWYTPGRHIAQYTRHGTPGRHTGRETHLQREPWEAYKREGKPLRRVPLSLLREIRRNLCAECLSASLGRKEKPLRREASRLPEEERRC